MTVTFLYEKEIDHFTKLEVQRSNWLLALCDQGHADVHRDPIFSVPQGRRTELRLTGPAGPSWDHKMVTNGRWH